MVQKFGTKDFVIVAGIAFIAWMPMLFVSFINDDFQIIGWNLPKSIAAIFEPIFTLHIWGYYWRPLVKLIYNAILYIIGFEPFLFHLVSLVLYSVTTGLVGYGGYIMGLRRKTAISAAIIFALLPSHELQAAWLSDMVENIGAISILLTFIFLMKYLKDEFVISRHLIISVIAFTFSLLSKEIAFVLFLLPALTIVLIANPTKIIFRKCIFFAVSSFIVFTLYLFYRITIISSNPFEARHLEGASLFQMIQNLLLYIPVSFVSPDLLEQLFYLKDSILYVAIMLLFGLSIIILLVKVLLKLEHAEKRIILFSAGWFLLFIIPVLPAFMRWYSFIASIGLVWIVAIFIERFQEMFAAKKTVILGAVIIAGLLFYYNLGTSLNWVAAGNKMDRIVKNISENRHRVQSDTIIVWNTPDKYLRVPLMKLGEQQIFNYALQNDTIEILSPLRSEITVPNSTVVMQKLSDSTFSLLLEGGRFLLQGGRSRKVLITEKINAESAYYTIAVQNRLTESGIAVGYAIVNVGVKWRNYLHLYYNGMDFQKVNF